MGCQRFGGRLLTIQLQSSEALGAALFPHPQGLEVGSRPPTLAPSACSFTGPAVSILDGDTIEVLHNTYPERVRLSFNNSLPYIDTYAYLWINNGNHTVTGILFEIVS